MQYRFTMLLYLLKLIPTNPLWPFAISDFKKKQSQYHSLLGHSKTILAPISSPLVSISQNSVRSGSQRVSEFPQW